MNEEIKERLEQIRRGELPNGYQRTKAGIFPDEWTVGRFSDILHNEPRPVAKPDKPYWRVGVRSWAKGTFQTYVDDPSKVDMEELYVVRENDLIVNITFAWEQAIALVKKEDDGLLVSHRFPTYVFDNGNVPFFYKEFASQHRFKYLLEMISPGGAGRNRVLDRKAFLNLPVPVPSLVEQQRIAEILSAQDSVIELKERLIAEKQRQKKYLMQQLLTGKQRLPGFTDDWKPYIVGKIGEFYGGLSGKSKDDFGTGSHSYITFKNVLENTVINPKQVARFRLNEGEKQNAVKKFDLFFNLSSETAEEVGMCAVLLEDLSNTYLNSFCIGFRTHEKTVLAHWLSYYFNSPVGREKMRSLAQGITRVNLNRAAFSNMTILIPSMEEQNMIADILSAADREIELLRASLEQEKRKKKALSQLLLTGIVRV